MQLAPIIPTDDKVPGIALQMSFGVGPSSAGDAPRSISLTGNRTVAVGTAVDETEYLILSADEASARFGPGSELHLMALAAFEVYPSALIYATAIAESGGTAATGTCVFANTASTDGVVTVECIGETITIPVASGEAHTVVSPLVETAINAQTNWPVTASDAAGTLTVTYKHKGPRGNSVSLRCATTAATLTVAQPATGYLTAGATSDDPALALDAIDPNRRHYIVAPYEDATNLADYKAHCVDDSAPTVGQRQVWIAASIDTLANATTLATTLNAFRGQIAHLENPDWAPSQMAAALGAYRCLRESTKLSYNYDGDTITGIPSQNDDSDIPNHAAQKSALNNGLTPLMSQADGSVRILRSITTRSQDSSGNASYNVLDTSKVIVPYGLADNIQAEFAGEAYRNKNIEEGDENGLPKTPDGITPKMARDKIWSILIDMEDAGDIENVAAHEPSLAVQIATTPDGRFISSIPCDVVEGFHQLDGDVRQIG